ncbi:Ku protein [Hydrocarboniphaga effusa]|uniref:non-homologous end joining protein Ku n=1 Tax=Hydrocarboniphaga effusa TaxID=243629 RepID=UPI00398BF384
MARPLWNGAISFGLLNIPVQLVPGERSMDLHFHLVDMRDQSRVRYERVSEETGDEVPWNKIARAFEYEKGNYVVLEKEDFANAAPESHESVDIEAFVEPEQIGPEYYDRPYFLVPAGKAHKGYVLLRDTLVKLGKVAVARVVIRTRERLALVRPLGEALQLLILRYPQEVVAADAYEFPAADAKSNRISPKERAMAEQLVESMSTDFDPSQYHDETRAKLRAAIDRRLKSKGKKVSKKVAKADETAQGNEKVVDFMALLRKSIDTNKRTPAAASVKKPARKSTPKKASKTTRRKNAS